MSGFWCGRSYSVRSRSGRGESDLRGGPFARTLSGIHAKHNGAILPGYIRSGSVSDFGGAGLGGPATGELVNTIALAIQAHVAAADIVTMQFCRQPASQPRLTRSLHPLVAGTGDSLRRRIHAHSERSASKVQVRQIQGAWGGGLPCADNVRSEHQKYGGQALFRVRAVIATTSWSVPRPLGGYGARKCHV